MATLLVAFTITLNPHSNLELEPGAQPGLTDSTSEGFGDLFPPLYKATSRGLREKLCCFQNAPLKTRQLLRCKKLAQVAHGSPSLREDGWSGVEWLIP